MFNALIKLAEEVYYGALFNPDYGSKYFQVLDGGEELIANVFGQDAANKFLKTVQGTPPSETEPRAARMKHFKETMRRSIAQLNVYKMLAAALEQDSPFKPKGDTVSTLEQIAWSLPRVIHELTIRHSSRPTLAVNDEYDLQDLFRALLYLYFADVRREEGTRSIAGINGRMDFLLFNEKTVVELKMTRPSLKNKELKSQIHTDWPHYHKHPDCKTLVAIVYDPGNLITNPQGVETDLTGSYNGMPVYTFIVQG